MGAGQSSELGGKSMYPIPGFIRNTIFAAVNDAEKLLGRPGNFNEIYEVYYHNYSAFGFGIIEVGYVCAIMQNLYREDIFYCDEQFVFWSTSNIGKGKEKYENFTTRFKRKFPSYVLDSTMHVRAGPTTRVVNLKRLMELFRSTDSV